MDDPKQTCPRRMQEYGPWEREEGLDSWSTSSRRSGEQTPFCSFCGSLHPARFLELIAEGWRVEPTDKNYKAYLRTRQDDASLWTKFYYQHLSGEQQQEFIDLYNSRQMVLAEPGHFYVLPFFIRTGQGDV